MKITFNELYRIIRTSNWAFQGNALAEGAIISIYVGKENGRSVYHQFERFNGAFHDRGLVV